MPIPGVVLFDLDGTLVDSARDIAAALSTVSCARGGAPILADAVRPLVSHGADVLVRTALAAVAGAAADDLAAFRAALAATPPDPAAIYPDVADALAGLVQAGHPLGIVTNKPERLARLLLSGLGLDKHFRSIVGGDTTPRPKPDPAPLIRAVQELAGHLTDAVLVGDSEIDARTAKAAGVPFVLFEGGYGAAACAGEPVAARFAAFADLPACLAGLVTRY